MKARCVIGAAAILCVLGGFGCEAAHQYARVSYPESVWSGSSDSLGRAVFAQDTQTRLHAQRLAEETGSTVAGADDSGN